MKQKKPRMLYEQKKHSKIEKTLLEIETRFAEIKYSKRILK